jgi:hypothetical protein
MAVKLYFIQDWINFEMKLNVENLTIYINQKIGNDLISGRKGNSTGASEATDCWI